MKINEYKVKLTLTRDMLATNPLDPFIHETHVLNRQRELITGKSKLNKEVNKYLDALQISEPKGEAEVEALIDKLEELVGVDFSDEERKKAAGGDLEFLKETFKEIEVKGTTVFFWNKNLDRPMIGDHMIMGFLKAAGEALCATKERENGKFLKSAAATTSAINRFVRVKEQFITFDRDIKRDSRGAPEYCQRSLRCMTAKGPRVSLAKSEVVEAGANLEFTLMVLDGSPIQDEHLHELFAYGQLKGLGQWRGSGAGQFQAEVMRAK